MQDVGRFVDLTIDFATLFNIDNFIRPYEMVSIVFLFADKDRCVDAVWSAITQVKVLSPEICPVALGQEFLNSEASIATRGNGECVSGVPGSEAMAGHSTVHNGTWDSHIVPDSEASNELNVVCVFQISVRKCKNVVIKPLRDYLAFPLPPHRRGFSIGSICRLPGWR